MQIELSAAAACRTTGHANCSHGINGLNVHAFHGPSRRIIHTRKLLRPEKCGRRGTRDRGTDGDSQAGCRILENAVEYGPIEVSFLRGRRLQRKPPPRLCEHLIRDFALGVIPQALNPAVPHSV